MAIFKQKSKQKSWDELYEDKKIYNKIRKYDNRESEKEHDNFILESRFQLMEDSLKKTKIGSNEFNDLLNECVNLFLEMNDDNKNLDKNEIFQYVKSRLIDNEIVGEFDGKKLESKSNISWPQSGRITLKDAISKKDIGQNPKAPYSKNVDNVFGGNIPVDSQPSPSSN